VVAGAPLTPAEAARIDALLDAADDTSLGDWDRDFVDDLRTRRARYRDRLRVTPRQWEQIERIEGACGL
jgi:hypothetical protein